MFTTFESYTRYFASWFYGNLDKFSFTFTSFISVGIRHVHHILIDIIFIALFFHTFTTRITRQSRVSWPNYSKREKNLCYDPVWIPIPVLFLSLYVSPFFQSLYFPNLYKWASNYRSGRKRWIRQRRWPCCERFALFTFHCLPLFNYLDAADCITRKSSWELQTENTGNGYI